MTFILSCCADTTNQGLEKGYYEHDVWAVIRNTLQTFSEKLDKQFNYIHLNDLNTIQTKEYNKPD